MSEQFSGKYQGLFFIALLLLSVFQSFDSAITNLSIRYIAGDLHLSPIICNWINTVFTIGNCVGLLTTGWLSRQFGEVRLLKYAICAFIFSSFGCALSVHVAMLIVFRFFLGLTVGISFPLLIALLIQLFPIEKKAIIVSSFFTLSILAPFIAPLIGGYFSQEFSWRYMFLINIPVGLFALVMSFLSLKDVETPIHKTSFDLSGLILLLFAVSMIKIIVDKGNQYDWFEHPLINIAGILGFLSFVYLGVREKTCDAPILNFSFFKEPQFLLGSILVVIGYIVVYGVVVLIPHLLITYMEYMPINSGATMITVLIFPVLFFLPIERVLKNNKPYFLILAFSIMMGILMFAMSFLTSSISQRYLQLIYAVVGLPISLFLPPLISFSIEKIEKEKLAQALSLFVFVRTFAAGLSSSLILYLWDRRIIFHKFRLIESATLSQKTSYFKSHYYDNLLIKEAAILATNDLYRLFSIMMLGFFLITVIYKRKSLVNMVLQLKKAKPAQEL